MHDDCIVNFSDNILQETWQASFKLGKWGLRKISRRYRNMMLSTSFPRFRRSRARKLSHAASSDVVYWPPSADQKTESFMSSLLWRSPFRCQPCRILCVRRFLTFCLTVRSTLYLVVLTLMNSVLMRVHSLAAIYSSTFFFTVHVKLALLIFSLGFLSI